MKEISMLTVKLFLITAIVSALLGAVNMITEPIIAENSELSFSSTMKELLPEADKFDLDGTKLPETSASVKVDEVYCGIDNDGEVVGYVTSAVSAEGYGGDIGVMVGVDNDGKITRVEVTNMNETPGLGAKAQGSWIDQFSGLGNNIKVDKNGSESDAEYKVEAISGATITSSAVTKAVNAALEATHVVIDDNSDSDSENEIEKSETNKDSKDNGESDELNREEFGDEANDNVKGNNSGTQNMRGTSGSNNGGDE